MSLLHVIILAIVQGFAELLPISSSAHVIVAEELMGMNPAAPKMTLLLVMLHTGTMLAVIVYFWQRWRRTAFIRSQPLSSAPFCCPVKRFQTMPCSSPSTTVWKTSTPWVFPSCSTSTSRL